MKNKNLETFSGTSEIGITWEKIDTQYYKARLNGSK